LVSEQVATTLQVFARQGGCKKQTNFLAGTWQTPRAISAVVEFPHACRAPKLSYASEISQPLPISGMKLSWSAKMRLFATRTVTHHRHFRASKRWFCSRMVRARFTPVQSEAHRS
jgi:hypothetical protein